MAGSTPIEWVVKLLNWFLSSKVEHTTVNRSMLVQFQQKPPISYNGRVVRLVRTLVCRTKGQGFEFLLGRQLAARFDLARDG
jgi:hypothetical protein